MAHNLYQNKMMYVGEKPWHGLGVELDKPATSQEAIVAAGLDYEVELRPAFVMHGDKKIQVKGKYAPVNCSTGIPLGIVGSRYKIIQNGSAFSFFDEVVGDGQAFYQTAGALGDGERIWILAKLPKSMVIFRDDVVDKYLILVNSHDGSAPLQMYFTPIRVVCQNTLSASLSEKGRSKESGVSIRHSGNIMNKASEARKALGMALDFYRDFELASKAMVAKKLTVHAAEDYFDRIIFRGGEETKDSSRLKNQKDELLRLFDEGKGADMEGIRHSVWTAYNAVTEWVDWGKNYRGTADAENQRAASSIRLQNIWFGSGAHVKREAFTNALELVSVRN